MEKRRYCYKVGFWEGIWLCAFGLLDVCDGRNKVWRKMEKMDIWMYFHCESYSVDKWFSYYECGLNQGNHYHCFCFLLWWLRCNILWSLELKIRTLLKESSQWKRVWGFHTFNFWTSWWYLLRMVCKKHWTWGDCWNVWNWCQALW